MSTAPRPRPLVLTILDGFGERESSEANAVRLAHTPNLEKLRTGHPHTLLGASGPDVGLPVGQMGNSEVGHLNFGAGRVAEMDLSKIDNAVASGTLGKNPVLTELVNLVKMQNFGMPSLPEDDMAKKTARLHLIGLVSDGGVHSSLNHLVALIDAVAYEGVEVVVHAMLDGRDTPPKSAMPYLDKLSDRLEGKGIIGTVGGRYYGMDRDNHWDRVRKAFNAIVVGECESQPDVFTAVAKSYDQGIFDEFVVPVRIGDYAGMNGGPQSSFGGGERIWEWRSDEPALCFNFRPDRMRELCSMLLRENLPEEVAKELRRFHQQVRAFTKDNLGGFTEYDKSLKMKVAYPKEQVHQSFGEVISRAGLKQFRCAETEKYAHVTYFFNGGHEQPFEGETRKLIPSPRDVPTYDKKPQMSADAITDEVVAAIESDAYDFILLNYANPDMVGHTGVLDAAKEAVESVDRGLGRILEAVEKKGGALLVTADHGNCETMVDETGQPHTAHTTNPVPFYYASEKDKTAALRSGGKLADVAPTMLEILGLPQPDLMTGRSLRGGSS